MKNIYNLTVYELIEAGRIGVNNGDVWIKQWLIDWCDANLSAYEIKTFVTDIEDNSRRLGIILREPGDLMLFELRWSGEFELLGPFTEQEMHQRMLPGTEEGQ